MSQNLSFVITGAGGDLGRSLAEFLIADTEVRLVLTTHREHDFGELQKTGRVLYCPNLNLTDEQDLATLAGKVDTFLKTRFHVLNCVGYFPGYKPLVEINISEARRVLESNLLAVYGIATTLLPLMQSRKGGHFLAFSSHTDYQSYPLMAAFTSAKAGLESLVRSIAHEYSKDGVVANTLAVATLATDLERTLKPLGDHENWLQLSQVCQLIRELIESPFSIMNGNTIHLYNHSESFFHQSYFERISSED
jgi:NAD(P)-dependent dehydrogenase (short-subunit alcohol dehydrogenase family)